MNPFNLPLNNTTIFLLPLMFPELKYDKDFKNHLKQAYLGTLDSNNIDKYTLLLKFINTKEELQFDTDFEKSQYDTFIKGEYDSFSNKYKQTILDFWEEDENSLLDLILNGEKDKILYDFTDKIDKDIIEQIKETLHEAWPPPNLILDELLLE